MSRASNFTAANPLPLLLLAALAATLPLLLHGVSCGQDMGFHLQSWLDAAHQLRHGHYPHWAFTPAWNAGEPRFLFYPPLSWLLGALLSMHLSLAAAAIVYIFIALAASGLTMHHLAQHYCSPNAALLAAALYLANPYMLFNAFERSAFAELLAAAWIPLLLLGILRERPTVRGIAVPVALLWLTNAPAAVMGCYMLALLAALRLGVLLARRQPIGQLSASLAGGTALGLALPAFYLVPAAYERRYIQIAMAIIPNMRVQDNFLFTHTADAAHNAVNRTASLLAATLLALAFVAIAILLSLRRKTAKRFEPAITLVTGSIAFMLFPVSAPLWLHLPDLAFLQFPWRLLTILSAVLVFAIGLLLTRIRPPDSLRLLAPVLALGLSFLGYWLYAQACEPADLTDRIATLFHTHHGAPPTDEYTPNAADNDVLRTDNPGYWFAAGPNDPAPNTTPTAAELNPSLQTDDTPVPDSQTLSTPAPQHFAVSPPAPSYLVLNLRDYPNWQVSTGCTNCLAFRLFQHVQRDDGLLAVPLNSPGYYTIDITWHRTADQNIGLAITALALLALALTFRNTSQWTQTTSRNSGTRSANAA